MTHSPQPLLHDALAVLRAPSQLWSAADGTLGGTAGGAIHGLYVSDVRLVRGLRVTVGGRPAEHIGTGSPAADRARIQGLLRHLDDPTPDPGVRLVLDRAVDAHGAGDTLTVRNRRDIAIETEVVIEIDIDATVMDVIKQGAGDAPAGLVAALDGDRATWAGENVTATLTATGLRLERTPAGVALRGALVVPAGGEAAVSWRLDAVDAIAAVRGADSPVPWSVPSVEAADQRLPRWLARSLADLDALRMTTAQHPDQQFLAAGAPWFFTLFGRDSIWAARFLLPLGTRLAGDTLRVLAGLQGTAMVDDTAEEPGKIMHELRRQTLVIDDGTSLPPLYYGTVDATALWICLLHDAWRWGMPVDELRALLPALRRALDWMRDHGDADGDGLLEYVDRSGHGLANQGWKDSGDSVQWRDGTLAEGPIALCEVQAYAYEAAMHGADLLDALGELPTDGALAEHWRSWAGALRERFHAELLDRRRRGRLPRDRARRAEAPGRHRHLEPRAPARHGHPRRRAVGARRPPARLGAARLGLRPAHDVDRERGLLAAQLPRRLGLDPRHRDRRARPRARGAPRGRLLAHRRPAARRRGLRLPHARAALGRSGRGGRGTGALPGGLPSAGLVGRIVGGRADGRDGPRAGCRCRGRGHQTAPRLRRRERARPAHRRRRGAHRRDRGADRRGGARLAPRARRAGGQVDGRASRLDCPRSGDNSVPRNADCESALTDVASEGAANEGRRSTRQEHP